MSSIEKLIPEIRESCKTLLSLTHNENVELENPQWYVEVGLHLHKLAKIYGGDITSLEQPNKLTRFCNTVLRGIIG